jgi:hypothetical protein
MQKHLSVDKIREILSNNRQDEMRNGVMPVFDCPPPHFEEVSEGEKGWTFFAKAVIGSFR